MTWIRKRSSSTSVTSLLGSPSSSSTPPGCKRPQFPLLQPTNHSLVVSAKALSFPSSQPPAAASMSPPPPTHASVKVNKSAYLLSPSSLKTTHKLRPKLAVYKGNPDTEHPEILVVGDSIVHFLTLPGAITYCLSGGKTADFIELIPALLDINHTIHTVTLHTGYNDIMARQSSKLHNNLKSLCYRVWENNVLYLALFQITLKVLTSFQTLIHSGITQVCIEQIVCTFIEGLPNCSQTISSDL